MPNISIQPSARTVEEVLTGPNYYRIPRFQRPFSWEAEHVDEFWNDAIKNFDDGYFIGPMVVYREDSRDLGVVDGQQRLTTISLILAALRDNFEAHDDHTLADASHRFVERPDPDGKQRFVLQSDVGEGRWIHEILQRRADTGPLRKENFDAPTWAAFSVVSERLADIVTEAQGSTKSEARRRTAALKALRRVRDQLLGLTVIWVPLDTEDDAYEIFETLNARGKDLEVSDRLKNLFLGHLRAANANVDDYRRRWNVIRELYDREPTSRDLNRFILHWWLSRAAFVAERKVFAAIKKQVPRREAASTFERFEKDANIYRTIVEPDSVSWTIERHPVRDSLRGLQIMRLAQPMPFVLALMRAYDAKEVTLKQVIASLRVIENYHFQVNAISTKSSSGGVSEMYASHARQLSVATTPAERRSQLTTLAKKLGDRKPTRDDFIEAFGTRLVFAEVHSRDKKLVQYVLARLHSHANPQPAADFARFSIEHLRPQSEIKTEDDLAVVGGIGNLFYLDAALNDQLKDKSFAAKKRLLGTHSSRYDIADVLSANTWGASQIASRATRLGGVAYDSVWRL